MTKNRKLYTLTEIIHGDSAITSSYACVIPSKQLNKVVRLYFVPHRRGERIV
ncbi:MAG: hypothetical protein R3Y40_01800 [Eubacteriales bacterium]